MGMNQRSQANQEWRTVFRFGLVGVANTAIDFLVFLLLHNIFGVFYLIAQVFSYACGVTNSYVLNRFWTFQSRQAKVGGEVFRFILVNGMSFAASFLILYGLDVQHMGLLWSKLIATVAGVCVNFVGSRFWVFRYTMMKKRSLEQH